MGLVRNCFAACPHSPFFVRTYRITRSNSPGGWFWSVVLRRGLKWRAVPNLDRPVETGRSDQVAILAECGSPDGVGVALQSQNLIARVCVPQLHRVVQTGGDEPPTIG